MTGVELWLVDLAPPAFRLAVLARQRMDEATVAAAKSIICRAIAACPVRLWVRLSAIVRNIWPGFRNA